MTTRASARGPTRFSRWSIATATRAIMIAAMERALADDRRSIG
jgi:hypothetical protein